MQNENLVFAPFIGADENEHFFRVFDPAIDRVEDECDYDREVFERPINLPEDPVLLERALSFWDKVCNYLTTSPDPCGHEYDCCGCFCGQTCKLEERDGQRYLRLQRNYNY